MVDGTLHRYFLENAHKSLHKWPHYFDIYETHLSRFRGKAPVVIEFGVSGGGSLAMWKEYFGDGSQIIGVDIDPACKQHEAHGINVQIGSQDDVDFLGSLADEYGPFDIVIDDASHRSSHMTVCFKALYNRTSKNGVYLIEDTHACYWEELEGGFRLPSSFMEFVKDRLDDINAVHARNAIPVSDFTRSTRSVTVYDSIVVFERKPQSSRQMIMTGPMG